MTKSASNRVRIAVQKSGRLSEESQRLLKRSGIRFHINKNKLLTHGENFPLDILLVRDDDIPHLVMDGQCDYGIVGTNVLEETALERQDSGAGNHAYDLVETLDYGACRLALAVPEQFEFKDISSIKDKKIATSYPELLKRYLTEQKVQAEVSLLKGSVEIAPRLGLADLICDLVSTGATLEANGLKEVDTVFKSNAVLIKNSKALTKDNSDTAVMLERRIHGVLQAAEAKYIMLHAPKDQLNDIVGLIPGAEHPSIMQLQGDDSKVVIHVVCRESIFWDTLESLKAAGASSILVLPVEKMMV